MKAACNGKEIAEFERSGDCSELYDKLGVSKKNMGCSGDGSKKIFTMRGIRSAHSRLSLHFFEDRAEKTELFFLGRIKENIHADEIEISFN